MAITLKRAMPKLNRLYAQMQKAIEAFDGVLSDLEASAAEEAAPAKKVPAKAVKAAAARGAKVAGTRAAKAKREAVGTKAKAKRPAKVEADEEDDEAEVAPRAKKTVAKGAIKSLKPVRRARAE